LIADEPTSMLDVSIRAGVLALLRGLRDQRGVSMLLITHDLASARALADRILVLSAGRIVESGPTERVISAPEHPYTQQLLAAVPGAGPLLRRPHTGAPP
jgi:peptide/nickel transport system ATP-binding protein